MYHEPAKGPLFLSIVVSLIGYASATSLAGPASPNIITLLLPGMKLDLKDPSLGFGEPVSRFGGKSKWTGVIGTLEAAGERFGGVVHPRGADLSLPRCLDTTYVDGDPRRATLFALDYSSGADVDGLAYKTLELAECLKQLRRFTGCQKVQIVAYSAGGLVARTYLQGALPQVRYDSDVQRLITVATPHMGSTMAEHFGDFLGTRATALKPNSELIWRLNNELDLPSDVDFASIVVRGVRIGSRRIHEVQKDAFSRFVDLALIDHLPLDYRKGCDQVVNVWSQNLALVQCARRYETQRGRPVQFLLARVSDPKPNDMSPFDERVHDVAMNDEVVKGLVRILLQDDGGFWSGLNSDYRDRWVQWQAKNCAFGIIEDAMARNHRLSEVCSTNISQLQNRGERGDYVQFGFSGVAKSKWRLPPRITATSSFSGTVDLKFDEFGRIMDCRFQVATR